MANFENHPLYPGYGSALYIAAGPMKEPAQLRPFLDVEDPRIVPVLTLGSLINMRWAGNKTAQHPQDFVYDADRQAAGNALGLPGRGMPAFHDAAPVVAELIDRGIKVNVSVSNLPFQKPAEVIPDMVEAVAEIIKPTSIEVNLSCPNGLDADGNLHPATCTNVDASVDVIGLSRDRVGGYVTLGAKDGPHTTGPDVPVNEWEVKGLVVGLQPYIDFLVGVNTIPGQAFPELTCTGGKGGMSGPIIAPVAKQHLRYSQEVAPDLAYISVGGVDANNIDSEYLERRTMGAMLVGGAQDFYRAGEPHKLALRWLINI